MLSRLGTLLNFAAIQFRLVEQFEGEDRVRVLAAGGQGATQPPLPLTQRAQQPPQPSPAPSPPKTVATHATTVATAHLGSHAGRCLLKTPP